MRGEGTITPTRQNRRGPSLDEAVVVVLGYAASGRAAAALLEEAGAKVRVVDAKSEAELGADAVPGGTDWLGREDPEVLSGADLVIASPGVAPTNPVLSRALETGFPVRSEIELGWWFTDAPTVAITGTNGKTTTTELLGAMGRAAGRKTVVAGNVGTPLSSLPEGEEIELLVLEISSFQLFLCSDFRPDVGALLNLTEDHLDWHPDFEHYGLAKANLFARQRPDDAAVLNGDDPHVMERFSRLTPATYLFRHDVPPERGAFLRDERVTFRLDGDFEPVFSLSEWQLPGRHNRENLLAASLAARLIGIDDDAIRAGARGFTGLPHRMEPVPTDDGVTWVNDSKSTNPDSLAKALDPEIPTILIAGGITKGTDFGPLREVVKKGARRVLLIGEGAAEIERAWADVVPVEIAGDLVAAVRRAAEEVRPGERVLFSPGCASFDQFENYAHRGESFRRVVSERRNRGRNEG